MADYGIKASKEGRDVNSNDPLNMVFSSQLDTLKIHEQGSYRVTKTPLASFEQSIKYIEHGLGYIPYCQVFLEDHNSTQGYGSAKSLINLTLPFGGYGQFTVDGKYLKIKIFSITDSIDVTISYIIYLNELEDTKQEGDFTMFKVGTFTSYNGVGNTSVTGVGFKPKLIKLTPLLTSSTGAYFSIGSTDGVTQFWSAVASDNHTSAQNGPAFSYQATNGCWGIIDRNDGSVSDSAAFVSFDDDGFTLSFNTAAARTIAYEAYG